MAADERDTNEDAGRQPPAPPSSPYSSTPPPRTELSARERAVLALERRNWPAPGAKERAIREELGLAPVRYYQLLNALLDDTLALAHDPVTVNRLRRVRENRRAER
ncbi:DUF3263 domain-containing protein [Streptomyces sp. NA04227]|uniref:DUF3263 domain-containing protein n=1 Tax=Streptomyces sp. NA04227 TaxID=2742136 RepID=UPI00159149B6|nr:DUF3263 domain-containing protein [Streptomyces sp. NA04227]QKW08283.1 DUF3263 domain-containing protein [Streptomyces sp. NA04227]